MFIICNVYFKKTTLLHTMFKGVYTLQLKSFEHNKVTHIQVFLRKSEGSEIYSKKVDWGEVYSGQKSTGQPKRRLRLPKLLLC